MARLSEHGIRLSSMSPSFLNSNSTSHTWAFSAVAELIDNASDPGVSAKQIWIDIVQEGDQLCLTFTDNGSGMTPNKLHKMLSFGFTEKGSGRFNYQAIGVYGNGFKSGSMRLGRDALIFTKNGGCQTVGMLSQTYLENIKAQAVIVPIVPFNQQTNSLVVTEDSEASLAAILKHSIINSQEQLLTHFDSIPCKKGTKILIWNIRRARDGNTEIDFETDPSDFRLPEIQTEELQKGLRNSGSLRPEQNIPDMYYSLRAYISILYLKPRTQVILRGKKILGKLVSKSLAHIEHDVYKPQFSKEKVKVTFGLNSKKKDHYGIMMYHKNRLIKAYEKVGCQLKVSGQRAGIGVIGIIECDFLKPAHNKQDFEYTKEYRLTLGALGLKLNDYWKEVTEKKAKEREFQALDRDDGEGQQEADAGPVWLQCEDCLKWRSIPATHYHVTPESWNCSMNPNPRYRSCSTPEDAEESEEQLTPSYQKTHKKLHKRKSESVLHSGIKKQCYLEKKQPDSANIVEELHPAKQVNTSKTVSSSQVENSDALQQTTTSHNLTYVLPATQTGMVFPLSRMEVLVPLEAGDREATVQRLATLENEVTRLRSLLGLKVIKMNQGTMTTADSSTEKPKEAKEPSEQNKPRRERTGSQSRTRVSDSELCDDSRSALQNLCDIRNNVVVLLTALLPQLDLSGISPETADIDNILQQIIEVNSLKL
ncbi:MORC family CW-type zinc finger protein 3 [Xenentodon cancila]